MKSTWIGLTTIAALAIGALSLRTTGVYFIMITLAFGQMFYYFAISWAAYGGEDGLSIYVRNDFPGLNTLVPIQFFGLCFAILCLVLGVTALLSKSPFGLALNAARQVPARVETVGLDPLRLKLVAFVISGTITGLAGGDVFLRTSNNLEESYYYRALARRALGWRGRLDADSAIRLTADWYAAWTNGAEMSRVTDEQIAHYRSLEPNP